MPSGHSHLLEVNMKESLTKPDIEYIQKYQDTLSLDDLAKDIGCSSALIAANLNTKVGEKSRVLKDLVAQGRATVMQKNISELMDEAPKTSTKFKQSKDQAKIFGS